MEIPLIVTELKKYESALDAIRSRFTHGRNSVDIAESDDPIFRQYVRKIIDLLNDILGPNDYSRQIAAEFNDGISNWLSSPSYKSVENILNVIRAVLTRLNRNPERFSRKVEQERPSPSDNVFIIHGHDEAKWRELKHVLTVDFGLNAIVLLEQPDAGAETVVEKFERYAQTCSYAIAIFTPDDEVSSASQTYLQARPNVIYELGWFCGKLGRSNTMLVLKEGTTLFTDFGGIIQKRFRNDVSEKALEIKRDLIAAGILRIK